MGKILTRGTANPGFAAPMGTDYLNTTTKAVWRNIDGTAGGWSPVETKNNFSATVDPVAGDDSGDGYSVGSRWVNVSTDKEFVCLDASAAAAVWTETTQGGGGLSTVYLGDGSDGAVTISSNTTLTRTMFYSSLTVNATYTLTLDNWPVFVTGTVDNNGTISSVGATGNNASGGTGGAETTGTDGLFVSGTGTAGAAQPFTDNANGTAGASNAEDFAVGVQAAGGTGGDTGTYTGGAGGTGTGVFYPVRGFVPAPQLVNVVGSTAYPYNPAGAGGVGGGSGAREGGTSSGAGGSGGGGGGWACIYCDTYDGTGGVITVAGGAGGNGAAAVGADGGGGAGGGGGNGGIILLVYKTLTAAGTLTKTGGAAGTGGAGAGSGTAGAAGSAGAAGIDIRVDLGADTITVA